MSRIKELIISYPNTFFFVAVACLMGLLIGLSYIWQPSTWIFIGLLVLWLIITNWKRDRANKRKKDAENESLGSSKS